MNEAGLPSGWKVTVFGDVVAFSKKPSGLRYSDYHQLPFIPMEFLPVNNLFFKRYILKNAEEITSGTYFEPGDILVAKITPSFENGKQGIIKNLPGSFGVATTEVIPFKEINNISNKFFLFYCLLRQSVRAELASKMEGSTGRQRLSKSALQGLEILLPPLPEQRAIARALRAVQTAREARLRELALERERKAALMEHLFRHGTRGEATKQTEIGEMPESWEILKLSDLCSDGQGFIQTGPFGSQLHSSDYKESGIPVVNPTHLGFNTINEESLPFISKEDADRLSKHYLIRGDILISRRGDFSRYSYITDHQSGWLCGTGCILIRINNPNVDNYFLSVLMGHNLVQDHFDQNSVGSIMPNLNTKILLSLPIILPHIEEQSRISSILRACDIKLAALDNEASLLDELFRAMLEELMSGRLLTKDLNEWHSSIDGLNIKYYGENRR